MTHSRNKLHSLLMFCSFYRHFFRGFAEIVAPFHELTDESVESNWGEEGNKAFQKLKEHLEKPPVFAFTDVEKPFVVFVEACALQLGHHTCNVRKMANYIQYSLPTNV